MLPAMIIKLINSYLPFFIFLFNMTMLFQLCVYVVRHFFKKTITNKHVSSKMSFSA